MSNGITNYEIKKETGKINAIIRLWSWSIIHDYINWFFELQKELELATSKPASINKEIQENLSSESKQLSIAQIIYSENKVINHYFN